MHWLLQPKPLPTALDPSLASLPFGAGKAQGHRGWRLLGSPRFSCPLSPTQSHLELLGNRLVAGAPWPGGAVLLGQLPAPESHSPHRTAGAQHPSPCKERGPCCLSPFVTEEGVSPALSVIPRAPNPDVTAKLRVWDGLCVELLVRVQCRVGDQSHRPMTCHSLCIIHERIIFDKSTYGQISIFFV